MTGRRPAPIPILWADEHLVVVDKPARVLVVSAPTRRGPTLVDLVSRQLGARLFPVHRLDEDTTGVLLLARTEPARTALERMFAERSIHRVYLALTSHAPSPPAGRIESRLAEGPGGTLRSVVRGGEKAITEYRLRARRGPHALVECRLQTGRRNQIRVHLAELGCVIVGDRKYGWRGPTRPRPLLHAWRIEFVHPFTGQQLALEAPPGEAELDPARPG
jgi:RluA family pseudouridine synthase